jgi:hypothetical protein
VRVIGHVDMTGQGSVHGGTDMQSTRPRDLGALLFVVGLFAVMLLMSLALGSPHLR